jgi:hypothetical protein
MRLACVYRGQEFIPYGLSRVRRQQRYSDNRVAKDFFLVYPRGVARIESYYINLPDRRNLYVLRNTEPPFQASIHGS